MVKIATDHSALQWFQSLKYPDGVTERLLGKLAFFDYEDRHRRGKSISHGDGLSRILPKLINAIETDLSSYSSQKKIPKTATALNNYEEVFGNVFGSKNSFAHWVSADFKMSAAISRHFKCKFSSKSPCDLDDSYTPLWPQWLTETRRYLDHLVMKQK